MNAERDHLASAYLDGELTDEERRIAESDPAVMAEVDRLRAVRQEISTVAAPTEAVRTASIAAAMDAFHELHAAPLDHLVPAASRWAPRWLGVAAAALVIGLLGTIVAVGVGRRGDDDSAAEPAHDEADAHADAMAEMSEPAAGTDDDVERLTESADVLADVPAEMAIAAEPADEPAEEPAAEEPAEEPAADATSAIDAGAHLDGLPMTSPEQLAVVGRHLLDLIDAHQLPPTPEHSCPFSDVLADGVYAEQGPTDVYIAVDTEQHRVLAIARTTCEVVVDTPLP